MCVCYLNFFFFCFSERDTLRTDLDLDNPPHRPRPFFLKTCTSSIIIIIINHLHDLQRHQQEEHQLRTGKGKKKTFFFVKRLERLIFDSSELSNSV